MKKSAQDCSQTFMRRYKSLFGASPETCAYLWNLCKQNAPKNSEPKHFLWALLFLKIYATEHVNAAMVNADEGTFRKWSWTFVKVLSELKLVRCKHFFL